MLKIRISNSLTLQKCKTNRMFWTFFDETKTKMFVLVLFTLLYILKIDYNSTVIFFLLFIGIWMHENTLIFTSKTGNFDFFYLRLSFAFKTPCCIFSSILISIYQTLWVFWNCSAKHWLNIYISLNDHLCQLSSFRAF